MLQPKCPCVLIIGGDSFIGNALADFCKISKVPYLATSRRKNVLGNRIYFDMFNSDFKELSNYTNQCTHALVTVAYSKINYCEEYPQKTYQLNVEATLDLAAYLSQIGITPVLLSSDVVFDGNSGNYTEESRLNPLNEYGRQKKQVEIKLPAVTKNNYLIARLSKVYSTVKGDGTLLDEMCYKISKGYRLREAYDQVFNPLYIGDLVTVLYRLLLRNMQGIVNLCGAESLSRYQIATALEQYYSKQKIMQSLIEPVAVNELNLGALRPKNTSMLIKKLRCFLPNLSLSTVKDTLPIIVNNWKSNMREHVCE